MRGNVIVIFAFVRLAPYIIMIVKITEIKNFPNFVFFRASLIGGKTGTMDGFLKKHLYQGLFQLYHIFSPRHAISESIGLDI